MRVVLADDHEVVRKGIRAIVNGHPQWTVCGEAENGQQAIDLVLELKPDLVVLDGLCPKKPEPQTYLEVEMKRQSVPTRSCLTCRDRIIEQGMITRAAAVAILLVVMLGFWAPNSRAEITGNELWSLHQESKAQFEMYVCGFFHGMKAVGNLKDMAFIPSNVTGQQIADIVALYLEKHPEKPQMPGSIIIVDAIVDAFSPLKK
jgi:CheY-like chemotaxis protein